MSASKYSSNLNELESKIQALERINFDLKLQLHYLNKKYSNNVNPVASGPEVNINLIEDRSIDILSLREELEYSKKRILELESELLQMQLIRDKERAEFQKALQFRPQDSAVNEETRRREREVAMAIAEHDALLIAKLRSDLEATHMQKEADKKIMNDLAAQLENKDEEIGKLLASKKALEREMEKAEEERKIKAQQVVSNKPASANPMLFSASSDGQQTSIIINSSVFAAGATIGGVAPNPTSFMIHGGPQNVAQASGQQMNNGFNGRSSSLVNYSGENNPSYEGLKYENQQLRQRLLSLEDSIRNQQTVIDNMKASATEIRGVEEEEVRRLESELDKSYEEKENLRVRLNKIEIDYELACKRIKELGFSFNYNDHDSNASGMLDYLPSPRSRSGGQRRGNDISGLYEKTSAQLQSARIEVQNLEKTVEMYRQRESELLFALEGVVQRCQELEAQVADYSRYRR